MGIGSIHRILSAICDRIFHVHTLQLDVPPRRFLEFYNYDPPRFARNVTIFQGNYRLIIEKSKKNRFRPILFDERRYRNFQRTVSKRRIDIQFGFEKQIRPVSHPSASLRTIFDADCRVVPGWVL